MIDQRSRGPAHVYGNVEEPSPGRRGRSCRASRSGTAGWHGSAGWTWRTSSLRTLLATIPAASATGAAINLTNLGTCRPMAGTPTARRSRSTHIIRRMSSPSGASMSRPCPRSRTRPRSSRGLTRTMAVPPGMGSESRWPLVLLDVPTINATPPTAYTEVTDPSVAFDAQHNVYVLSLENTGANDGALLLTKFNFSGPAPPPSDQQTLPNNGIVYQWVSGSDAVTTPVLSVNASPPAGSAQPDPNANNVYIAWASIDTEPANPNPYAGSGYNPNLAELVVGTPVSTSGVGRIDAGIQRRADGQRRRQFRRQLRPAARLAPAARDQPERRRPGHRSPGMTSVRIPRPRRRLTSSTRTLSSPAKRSVSAVTSLPPEPITPGHVRQQRDHAGDDPVHRQCHRTQSRRCSTT